jgi:hypothetical protein
MIKNNSFKIVSFGTSSAFDPILKSNTMFTYSGSTGSTGSTGPRGTQGSQGPTGSSGIVGFQGPMGKKGPSGPTGLTGPKGFQGYKGPTGATGVNGATGYNGLIGATGSTGLRGFNGSSGDKGNTGLQGYTGSLFKQSYTTSSFVNSVDDQFFNISDQWEPFGVGLNLWTTSGPSFLASANSDGLITITDPGVYEVIWSLSLRSGNSPIGETGPAKVDLLIGASIDDQDPTSETVSVISLNVAI